MATGSTDPASTATLEAARAHARRQAGIPAETGPTVPSSAATNLPDGVEASAVVWDERIGAGGYAARLLARDSLLRVDDAAGDGCVQLVVYNAARTSERLNVADTVKVQWQAYLGAGSLLLSDMGRVLMTLVDDTSGRHDCLCGSSTRRGNDRRYGDGGVWGPAPNARDLLALAAARFDLTRRDLPPAINLFKGVRVDDAGALHFDGAPNAGASVTLRAEVDVIVLLSNTPHVLDPRPDYTASTIRCTAWRATPPDRDPFRSTTPERERAFLNTDEFLLGANR